MEEDESSQKDIANSTSPSSVSNNSKLQLPPSCDPPSSHNPPKPLVWLVFGATGHMGRSVVKAALGHGDYVSAVGRTFEDTMQAMQGWHENCQGLLCDVRVRETVEESVQHALDHWGRIDIIANCSGYGVIGACEDQDEYEIRNQFETNFMGVLNIIQLSLPYFREQGRGRYLIFSSTSGALGVPGLGPYCATKYAVEGLIESMLYEVDAFNIKATLVEPGHVRRDELSPKSVHLPQYGHFFIRPPSEPYSAATSPASHAKRVVQWIGDNQPTSAIKAAELVWQLAHCSFPPLRLLLGSYAVESIRDRLRSIIEEIEDWKHLNFPITQEPDDISLKREQEDDATESPEGGASHSKDEMSAT
ncbi:MAG: hypothetical protein M1834_000341 [Cirrosporium novae-zelandiae]|nr:MAG: hypothetical protein M1834_000341 [Cirrosporium novae-zelandiae]